MFNARTRAHADLATAGGAFLLVVAIAQADGGYFPTAWGLCVLALAWVVVITLVVGDRLELGRWRIDFLSALLLLVGWTALSIVWSSDTGRSVLEVERGLIYLVGALACALLVRGRAIACLLAGLTVAVVWVSLQALHSRLSAGAGPGPGSAQVALGRLALPIAYPNALAILAAMGALLAVGFAVHARPLAGRAAAASALPVLLTTAYFTFSRGAALALGAGFVAAVALDPRRLRFVPTAAVVALPAATVVWLASRASALTSARAARGAIAAESRTLVIELVVATLASAVVVLLRAPVGERIERRLRASRRARRACIGLAAAAAIAVVAAVALHSGGHVAPERASDPGAGAPVATSALAANDLNERLGSRASSGRADDWRVALREFKQHPWLGSGAGTYELFWLRYRPNVLKVRDAHSLYLETLAQLGLPGLAFVVLMLALPLRAAILARHDPLVVGAFGAYVAYVLHTGIDWDWEVPAVTLVAVACGVALLAAADEHGSPRRRIGTGWRALGVAAVVAAAVASMVGLVANRALAQADRAAYAGDPHAERVAARTALRWAPWSAEAYRHLGRAQIELGQSPQGHASLVEAVRRGPSDWRIWYDLALASHRRQRTRALDIARRLNPREVALGAYPR